MIEFLIKAKNFILDILFPPLCLNCRKMLNTNQKLQTTDYGLQTNLNQYLCNNCYNSIQLNTSLFCPVCRLRLADFASPKAGFVQPKAGNKKICGHANYLLAAAGNYDDPVIKNLIHYFKYKSFENLAPILGEILLNYLKLINFQTYKLSNFIIVPVPLHRAKERQRGFNQSKLLAEYITKNFNLELMDILKRTKNTKPQAQCKSEERIKNISDCFQIKNPVDAEKIKNKNILLIDDVFTSGATINEAVKVLKQNGCRKIIALVAAKA